MYQAGELHQGGSVNLYLSMIFKVAQFHKRSSPLPMPRCAALLCLLADTGGELGNMDKNWNWEGELFIIYLG